MLFSARASAALGATALACWGQLVVLTPTLEPPAPRPSMGERFLSLTREQAGGSAEMPRPPGATFKKIIHQNVIYELHYGFQNFNQDRLKVEFTIVQAELEGSLQEFGYSKKELDAIFQQFSSQGEAAYRQKVQEYFIRRGFRIISKDTVTVDIPQMIRRNLKRVNGLAQALQRVGEEQDYDSDDLIGAATAMIQTAMAYKIPPTTDGSRQISGVLPPPKALVNGWGDCDTKSALLGAVLANWSGIRGVGLALPRHYLIGIARVPRQGDVFVEHNGVQYVLIEPAGPAWLIPGTVGEETLAMLDRMHNVPIQPF